MKLLGKVPRLLRLEIDWTAIEESQEQRTLKKVEPRQTRRGEADSKDGNAKKD